MAITPPDISTDYIINYTSGSITRSDRTLSKTVTNPSDGSKTVTFNNHFGMGYFGTVPSSVILRFGDGSLTHDFTAIDAGEGNAGSYGTANQFAAGSDRPANYVVDEMVEKLNASSLNITAVADSGNTSTNASLSVTPGSGATVSITEDPTSLNSGEFGGSAGFTVITDSVASSNTTEYSATPFRFSARGAFNLRGQTSENHYKVFIGEEKS